MSAAFAKGKGRILNIYVPTRAGFVQRSTGTPNKQLARKMSAMVRVLRDERQWWLLDAIRERRLSVSQLYDHYASNTLDSLRAQLNDSDVVRHLDAWEASVKVTRGDTGTAEMYRWQVERFTGERMLVSEITPAKITGWLAGLGVTPGTARKNLYALSSFVRYLRTIGALDRNPLELVQVPKKNPPRLRFEALEVCQAIVDAQEEPYRTISAFIHATGAEIGAVLRMVPRDIDLQRMLAHAPGSKAITRNRYDVVIEGWAKPYLERHLALHDVMTAPGVEPIDYATRPIFAGISRYKVYWFHKRACAALKIDDLTVHDARHSLAVRWRKRGVPLEVIASQLGHQNVLQVATIYGRFQPTMDERQAEVRS
jgi:integrase